MFYFTNSSHSPPLEHSLDAANGGAEPLSPARDVPPPSPMRICLLTICCVGIALNAMVFFRRHHSTSSRLRQNSSVRKSMLLLRFMAAADTVSLAALMLALCTQYLGIDNQERLLTVICKADLFVIHSASAFSIWCWLLLSAVRYVAVYRPYAHLKLDNEPMVLVAGLLAVVCCVLEMWILYDVSYIAELRICGETLPEQWGRRFQLLEILWTYFLPLSLITLLDVKVLCCHETWKDGAGARAGELDYAVGACSSGGSYSSGPTSSLLKLSARSDARATKSSVRSSEGGASLLSPHPAQSWAGTPKTSRQSSYGENLHPKAGLSLTSPAACTTSTMSTTENLTVGTRARWTGRANERHAGIRARRRAQQLRMLKRCLCISILDLGMNLPNYLIRLYLTVVSDEELERLNDVRAFLWLQDASQLLYFAQFSLNALYLVGIIYVSPKKRKETLRASIRLSQHNTTMSRVNSQFLQKAARVEGIEAS